MRVSGSPSRTMFLKKKVTQGNKSQDNGPGSSPRGSPSKPSSSSPSPASSPTASPSGSRTGTGRQQEVKDEPKLNVPSILVAYFLYEREVYGTTYLAFCSSETVYIIDKEKVLEEGKISVGSLVKGTPFRMKVSITNPVTPLVILPQFNHCCIDSFSAFQSQDLLYAPEILCRVMPSANTSRPVSARNFQFMPARIKAFNVQIPDTVTPEALVQSEEIWAMVKFTSKSVRRTNGSFVQYPSVVKGNFRLCNHQGQEVPRSFPRLSFSAETVGALKKGLGANIVIGGLHVDFEDCGCLLLSDWDIEDHNVDESTSFDELLRIIAKLVEPSDIQSSYLKAHFGRLSDRKEMESGSLPTLVFIPGLSSALPFRLAEVLAVRAASVGCRALVLAPSALVSSDANFSDVNSPRANEVHSSTLYKINQPVQLGVLERGSLGRYDYEDPTYSTYLLAYDMLEKGYRLPVSLQYPVVEVDLEGVSPLDFSYLSDPKKKFVLHVNATPAAVKASNLKSKVLGSFSFDRDPTERSNRLASLKAFLPSEKARDDLVSHLKLYQGTTTMKPEEVNPTVSESTRLVTIKLLHGELSFSHIVSFLSGLGCSSDAMYFLSNDVLRIRLPLV